MLVVTVELLHGTIRAGSPDDTALTGRAEMGEWPPSPARLFAALVAADGTRDRCRVSTGTELTLLEAAPPPSIYADPLSRVALSALRERFVVLDAADKGTVQDYPARKNGVVRPGVRLAPATPRIVYVWDDVDLPDDLLGALARRAARVAYLGCADSPVRVRVTTALTGEVAPLWRPDPAGSASLPVPFPGLVDVLDDAFDRWSAGELVRRSWFRADRAAYRPPDQPTAARPAPASVWLRFARSLPGRSVLRVTETLRAAVLDLYQRHVTPGGELPAVLHGHGFTGGGFDTARYLALPDVGHRHATGRLHGAAVWLPPGTPAEVVEGLRTVAWQLRMLHLPGGVSVEVHPYAGEDRPRAATPPRWSRPARRWVSVFPVVHERRTRHGPDLAEVTRWCRHAGLPDPIASRVSPAPLLAGAPTLAPHEVFRRPDGRRPYSHLAVEFADPVSGPVVLGRARQFGLGLLAPQEDRR